MKKLEYYVPNADELFAELYEQREAMKKGATGFVRFRTFCPSDNALYDLDLTQYNNFETEEDMDRYLDYYLERYHQAWDARKDIMDGQFPVINPFLGIGDFAAFIDGDITFTIDTSWTTPILEELRDYKKLPPLGTAKWFHRYMRFLEKTLERIAHTGIPFNRGWYSPFDLAEALAGSRIYMDFYDDPEGVHELLDYCTKATIFFMDAVIEKVKEYIGHTKHGMYYLDNLVNMSEDIATNISPDLYTEFCKPYTQRVINHFGYALMHTHSTAMYLIEPICTMDNVINMWLPTDPNAPVPIELVDQVVRDAHGVMHQIDAKDFQLVIDQIPNMLKGNFEVAMGFDTNEECRKHVEIFNKALSDYLDK